MLKRLPNQNKTKSKKAIIVSPFGFLQANIRVYMARYDVGADTMANYGEALKLIDNGGYQYVIIEILGDALTYSDQIHFLNRFLNFCSLAAKEAKEQFKIIVITPVKKEQFAKLFDVEVDFVVNKNDDWYDILNDIIHDTYDDGSGPSYDAANTSSSMTAVNKALDELNEEEMLALMEERLKGDKAPSRLVHTELHDTDDKKN